MLRYEIRICEKEGFELYAGKFDEEFVIKHCGKTLLLTDRENMILILNKIKLYCYIGGWSRGDVVCFIKKEIIDKFINVISNFGCNPCW